MRGKQNGMSKSPALVVRSDESVQERRTKVVMETEGSAAAAEGTSFDRAVRQALTENRISDARTLVANAEAVLFAHEATSGRTTEGLSRAQLASAKARIAIATGDGMAARAILVRAIETEPQTTALRALMTEVMMADGRATDVRPVLQHLGNRPRQDHAPTTDAETPNPPWRGTSS